MDTVVFGVGKARAWPGTNPDSDSDPDGAEPWNREPFPDTHTCADRQVAWMSGRVELQTGLSL